MNELRVSNFIASGFSVGDVVKVEKTSSTHWLQPGLYKVESVTSGSVLEVVEFRGDTQVVRALTWLFIAKVALLANLAVILTII